MTAYQLNNYDVNSYVELFDLMHVGALFCLIVAKLFMMKVCMQSVQHSGIKFAMAF